MNNSVNKSLALLTLNIFLYMLLILVMFFFSQSAKGQSVQDAPRKYRVTAYKAGGHTVTSQSNIAKVVPTMSLHIPSAFTPDNDGLNDKFGVAGQGIAEFEMKIYNSWGQLIFESRNADEKWDGYYKGEKVPSDVYLYRISARSVDGDAIHKSGNLTLL